MKYTVNTQTKTINIESQMSAEELKGLCEQYPDYSFSGNNYVPYYQPLTPPYYHNWPITLCDNNDSITHSKNIITVGTTNTTNLMGVAQNGCSDTTQGFAGSTCTIANGRYSAGITLTHN